MKSHKNNAAAPRSAIRSWRLLVLLALCSLAALPFVLKASAPIWWSANGVIDQNQVSNDYAAANQGQLKFIAEQAMHDLDAHLPDGAGDEAHALVQSWHTNSAGANDFAPVNLGQLKAVAKPFYNQLVSVGYTNTYPWTGHEFEANNHTAANIGQIKNLFKFDVAWVDPNDSNGLPDWWEQHYFHTTNVNPSNLALRGDGLTILQVFQQGLNPNDFYNGKAPTFTIINGDGQTGAPDGFAPQPLVVSVVGADGYPAVNAPVSFTVGQGSGTVQKSKNSPPTTMVKVLTSYNGQAKAFFRLPNTSSSSSTITAMTGIGGVPPTLNFTEYTDNGQTTSSYQSPFAPSNMVVQLHSNGSEDVSWENNNDDPDDIPISVRMPDGSWQVKAVVPAGTTHVHIPAP